MSDPIFFQTYILLVNKPSGPPYFITPPLLRSSDVNHIFVACIEEAERLAN